MITQINKAILHIFDKDSGITIYSNTELDCTNADVINYLKKHIEKAFKDTSSITSVIDSESDFIKSTIKYKEDKSSFVKYSVDIGKAFFKRLLESDNLKSVDLVICDFFKDAEKYIGIVELQNQIGYVHHVSQENNIIKNDIVKHFSILPNVTQKILGFALVNLDTFNVRYIEPRRFLNGQDIFILPSILCCVNNISQKETITAVKSIALQLSETYQKNAPVVVSRVKAFLAENAEVSESLDTVELSHVVFPESDEIAETFVKKIKDEGIPPVISVEKNYAMKEGKKHKIKTDTGIEITVPVDFFDNSEYIEFINNPNGTISIAIKNIGKIINK